MHSSTQDCDLLIVGSGASGLSAALTASVHGLKVIVCEQADVVGGATAISGGELWIPLNRQNRVGTNDSHEHALAYLHAAISPGLDIARASTFVHNAADALAFIEDHSELRYESLPHVVDYFSDRVGATEGVRTLGALPFDGRKIGRYFEKIRPPLATGMIFGGMAIGREDFPHLYNVTRSPRSVFHVARMLSRHARDRLVGYSRGTRMVMGNALVGGLVHALLERGVQIQLNCRITGLASHGGRVTGARLQRDSELVEIRCNRAVLLATGSFSGSLEMRSRYFGHVARGHQHVSPLPPTNDGSGMALATSCGGSIDDSAPEAGAWAPMSTVTLGGRGPHPFPHFGDRAKPGVIVVNPEGRRFANEALNYHDFQRALLLDGSHRSRTEAFIIASHNSLRRYGLGRVPAFPGRIEPFLRSGYLKRASSITDLARQIDVDATELSRTIDRFNTHALAGHDPDFHKGGTVYERAAGDATQAPNPCVADLRNGPWYAIRLVPGDIGTMHGVRVDAQSRVVGAAGEVIEGLYAVGTAAASIMRGVYPAAGVMLGPAVTFGHLTAKHLALSAR